MTQMEGRAGSPLSANGRVLFHHDGAQGLARPTGVGCIRDNS